MIDEDGTARPVSPILLAPYDKVLTMQLGLLRNGMVGRMGLARSATVAAALEQHAAQGSLTRSQVLGVASRPEAEVTTREAFQQLVREALEPPGRGYAAVWRSLAPRSVYPGAISAMPPRRWREVRIVRHVTVWTRDGVDELSAEVVDSFGPRPADGEGVPAERLGASWLLPQLEPAIARLEQQGVERGARFEGTRDFGSQR